MEDEDRNARATEYAKDFATRRDLESRRAYARRPKKIADVVAQLITKRGYGRLEADDQLAGAWSAAAGSALAAVSRVGKVRRSTLEVWVANSIAMQEFSFEKQRIVEELARTLPDAKIRALKFRVGQIK